MRAATWARGVQGTARTRSATGRIACHCDKKWQRAHEVCGAAFVAQFDSVGGSLGYCRFCLPIWRRGISFPR